MVAGNEAASAVDGARLISLIDELSTYGALSGEGVDRQTLTRADIAARRFLLDVARSYGAHAFRDAAANFFFRWPGTTELDPVVTGSHVDSQPCGGSLDGAYGVCAAIEVLAALASANYRARRPIEVVIWTNEEGCRFSPGTMGSSAFVRPALLERFRASVDGEGQTFAEALRGLDAQCFDIPVRNMSLPFFAFIEAHIEGGTVLEDAATPLGIVEGVQGARWFTVRIAGRTAHPGTTPLARKQDALMAAVEVAADIYKVLRDGDERLRLTIGRMLVTPGSINVVPGEVVLSVDLRHPDTAVLDTTEATIRELARPVAGCSVEIERTMLMNPTRFDPGVVQTLTREAERLHLPYLLIGSGSFHDALRLSEHCPTGMLFVPSVGGVSHHPDERTEPRDLVIGARLLAQAVVDLADQ